MCVCVCIHSNGTNTLTHTAIEINILSKAVYVQRKNQQYEISENRIFLFEMLFGKNHDTEQIAIVCTVQTRTKYRLESRKCIRYLKC